MKTRIKIKIHMSLLFKKTRITLSIFQIFWEVHFCAKPVSKYVICVLSPFNYLFCVEKEKLYNIEEIGFDETINSTHCLGMSYCVNFLGGLR